MDYYGETARSYNELHGQEQTEKAQLMLSKLRPKGLLLDVGAGTGIATKVFEQGCECIALEPSIEMLKQYSGLKVVGKAEQLPFKDKAFDCVVSLTALHHANLVQAKQELLRVTTSGASVGISFFKRASNFKQAGQVFKEFDQVETKFDVLFLRK